jgi:tetratricopeptide (TPR) repeat protein
MNILNRLSKTDRFEETRFVGFHLLGRLLFGALLISASLSLQADELQDATQLFKQGQQNPALSKVNNFLASRPKDAQGRFLKGLILTEQGKTADAIKIFSDLTQDYPELPEPYNNLAVLYASQGQYDKAKSALEMAIRTHPSYATAHENLGDIYAKMASQAYDRALQLDSSNTTTQTKLAMIQDLFSDKPRNKSAAQRNPVIIARPAEPVAKPVPPTVAAPVATPAPAKPTVVAEKPVEKPEVVKVSAAEKAVQETVENWAEAWSSKNVKKYLTYYSADFKTPDGESRSAWAATRKERINRPKHIEVRVSDIKVDFTDHSHATVKFHQNYRASNFKAGGGKTLMMVKSGSSWFIQEERTH